MQLNGRGNRRTKSRGRQVNGILVLDKPRGISSNAALQQAKRIFNAGKAGHTGSLDPLATGVLPVCFGEATKLSQFLLDSDKRYRVGISLGVRTDTGDAEGQVIGRSDRVSVTEAEVRAGLERFTGVIEQVPPMYSAIKLQGVPLYKLAREGKEVERDSREVTIYSIDLLRLAGEVLELEVHCSKGTYIRTLADDLGQLLGCGAHVSSLRRLQAGVFGEQESVTLEELAALRDGAAKDDFSSIDGFLVAMDEAVRDLPEVRLPETSARWIRQGQPVIARHLPAEGLVRLYGEEDFLGIGIILDDGRVAPRRMIVDHKDPQ